MKTRNTNIGGTVLRDGTGPEACHEHGGDGLAPRLVARHVSKLFAGERALNDVDLRLYPGEVHALLGANGSGKSTLIKVLAGYHHPEPGAEIVISGARLATGSARAAHAAGLRFIHQDLGLIDDLDARENLLLVPSAGGHRRWWLSERREVATARALLASYGLDVDPRAQVASLSVAEKSMVAIIRTVGDGVAENGILVLDEPTASLPPQEVARLMTLIDTLKRRGVAILFVTHRLQEVFEVADAVTVLRDGQRITTEPASNLTRDRLLELMLGAAPSALAKVSRSRHDAVVFEVRGLAGGTVQDASFSVHQGEILGLAGLIGSGYEAVLGLAFGAGGATSGSVTLEGSPVPLNSPKASIDAGVAFAPAERRRLGAFGEFTLRENVTMPALISTRVTRRIQSRAEQADSEEWLRKLSVVPCNTEIPFDDLSGGNQQKVVLARWLRCRPKVLLIDEPTIGVDAGAKLSIYPELRNAANAGAVVIASSDVEELCDVCDRILVFGGGRISHELAPSAGADGVMAATLSASA